jgi:hypothetical protein
MSQSSVTSVLHARFVPAPPPARKLLHSFYLLYHYYPILLYAASPLLPAHPVIRIDLAWQNPKNNSKHDIFTRQSARSPPSAA